jgi:DNA-binding NtrC family response regulator
MAEDRPVLMIVDDDLQTTNALQRLLEQHCELYISDCPAPAKILCKPHSKQSILALLDLNLLCRFDTSLKFIRELHVQFPIIKIYVWSKQKDGIAMRALALGATDWIAKTKDNSALLSFLVQHLKIQSLVLTQSYSYDKSNGGMLGTSPAIKTLIQQTRQFADSPFPVLIEGESGVGKEHVAKNLHEFSQRAQHAYMCLNCAAISPMLTESILFGHGKGAFTGASSAHTGYFEDVGEGSLFLDEIGDLPFDMQAKLLRVLESGEYNRVGETSIRKCKARIVAATNRDLREEVHAGRFRADLFHRLNVLTIKVPPLRELGQDRLLLLNHFKQVYATKHHQLPFSLDVEAECLWFDYHFPGNVRELRNIIIRLTAKFAGQVVSADQLSAELGFSTPYDAKATTLTSQGDLASYATQHLQTQEVVSLDTILKSWERAYIGAAMEITHGNLSNAAKLLGLKRTTLYSRLQL